MAKRSGKVHPAQPHPRGSANPRAKIFVPKPSRRVTRIGNYAQETGELPPEFAETTGRYRKNKKTGR